MTIQDLKDNRNEIISKIEERFSTEAIKEVMNLIVYNAEFSDDLEFILSESFEMYAEKIRNTGRGKKDSALTRMRANYELNNDVRYNPAIKQEEKY